jgi:hypothetical protein
MGLPNGAELLTKYTFCDSTELQPPVQAIAEPCSALAIQNNNSQQNEQLCDCNDDKVYSTDYRKTTYPLSVGNLYYLPALHPDNNETTQIRNHSFDLKK